MGQFVDYAGQKRPVWKPSRQDLILVRKCGERGLTAATIVAKIREGGGEAEDRPVTVIEFERSITMFPALFDAYEAGKANGEIVLTEKLWAKALSDSNKDQLQAIKFLLEKRFGWSAAQGQQGSNSTEQSTGLPTGLSTTLVDSK